MDNEKIVTVYDYMLNNDDVKIEIDETPTLDDIGIFNECIYSGRLSRVPKKYWNRRVVSSGYMLFGKCHKLCVIKD